MATIIQSDKVASTVLGTAVDFGIEVPTFLVGYTFSACYSTRRLRQDYAGPVMRIREKTTNAYADLAFDGYTISPSSICTITAAGTSGWSIGSTRTLANFAGSGDVGVHYWYDQSGNGRYLAAWISDLTQQPTLVTAGVLEVNEGYPCVTFNGTSNRLGVNSTVSVAWTETQPWSCLAAVKVSTNAASKGIWSRKTNGVTSPAGEMLADEGANARQISAGTNLTDANTLDDAGKFRVYAARYNGASSKIYVDGVETASGNAGTNAPGQLDIGYQYWGYYTANKYHELLFFPEASTDLTVLSTKVMAYYGLV